MIRITSNIEQFARALKVAEKKVQTAGRVAMRVEANRLRLTMKKEIREGAPGGRKFKDLSVMRRMSSRPRNRKALSRLAIPVRYWEGVESAGNYGVFVGYHDKPVISLSGSKLRGNQLSKSWLRIVNKHQEGFSSSVSEDQRRFFAHTGSDMKKGRNKQASAVFFLRANRMNMHTPARPIIDPFWSAHQDVASRNIVANFERKLRGERI